MKAISVISMNQIDFFFPMQSENTAEKQTIWHLLEIDSFVFKCENLHMQ